MHKPAAVVVVVARGVVVVVVAVNLHQFLLTWAVKNSIHATPIFTLMLKQRIRVILTCQTGKEQLDLIGGEAGIWLIVQHCLLDLLPNHVTKHSRC